MNNYSPIRFTQRFAFGRDTDLGTLYNSIYSMFGFKRIGCLLFNLTSQLATDEICFK